LIDWLISAPTTAVNTESSINVEAYIKTRHPAEVAKSGRAIITHGPCL